jgi:hypothetical protein
MPHSYVCLPSTAPFTFLLLLLALSLALNCTQWQQLIKQIYPSDRPSDFLSLNTPAIWYRSYPAISAHTLANESRDRQPFNPY